MTSDQLGGIIRAIMAAFSGWALEHGFTNDQWLATSGGVIAIITVVWSIYSNSTHQLIQTVADKPEVSKVVTSEPGLALQIPNDKVVAR